MMTEPSAPSRVQSLDSTATVTGPHKPVEQGVAGWLLALCWMLTIVGPLVSVGLLSEKYAFFARYLSNPGEVQVATALVSESAGDGSLLQGVMQSSTLSLVFFTACFAYLNKSARVQSTYRL